MRAGRPMYRLGTPDHPTLRNYSAVQDSRHNIKTKGIIFEGNMNQEEDKLPLKVYDGINMYLITCLYLKQWFYYRKL